MIEDFPARDDRDRLSSPGPAGGGDDPSDAEVGREAEIDDPAPPLTPSSEKGTRSSIAAERRRWVEQTLLGSDGKARPASARDETRKSTKYLTSERKRWIESTLLSGEGGRSQKEQQSSRELRELQKQPPSSVAQRRRWLSGVGSVKTASELEEEVRREARGRRGEGAAAEAASQEPAMVDGEVKKRFGEEEMTASSQKEGTPAAEKVVLHEAAIVDGEEATITEQSGGENDKATAQRPASEQEEEARREATTKEGGSEGDRKAATMSRKKVKRAAEDVDGGAAITSEATTEETRDEAGGEVARAMPRKGSKRAAEEEVSQEGDIVDGGAATISKRTRRGNDEASAQESASEPQEEERREARTKEEARSERGERGAEATTQRGRKRAAEEEAPHEAAIVNEVAALISKRAEGGTNGAAAPSSPPPRPRRYRGGFTTSICDVFRDPHRRTDCCAVACCGVLSGDRSRYLLTGERPSPLWCRLLVCVMIPALFVAAMHFFAVDVPVDGGGGPPGGGVDGGDGEGHETEKVAPSGLFWSFVIYIIILVAYGFVKNQRTRREIMTKLYEERARERGEEVNTRQIKLFLSRHSYLDTVRAHCLCSFCYRHDHDFYDETLRMIVRDGPEEDEGTDEDFCTRLWECLSSAFWCCGCWCQCFGLCALAQEEREVNRLTGNEEHKIDYLTFQPYSDYYPSIRTLREERNKSPWKHLRALSDLSVKLLVNVAAVLLVLLLIALSDVDSNFTWENMIVFLLTLGQALFIEYLVHWRWNLFDLSFDSVVKYFACGFLLVTPMAVVFEMILSCLAWIINLVLTAFIIVVDSELAHELESHPEKGMEELDSNYPALFVFSQFLNAFFVAALIEEMAKYFGYRMVVTPDLLPGGRSPAPRSNSVEGLDTVDGSPEKNVESTGAGITVAMVSVALGFACCENLMYIFVYSPPSLGVQVSTLVARSLFPVHPLCAAIQSIGVCKRDLEGSTQVGLGRIVLPAVLLHGSFDFVMMVWPYFQQREDGSEGDDDDGDSTPSDDGTGPEDLSGELLPLICGLVFVIAGYVYYVVQSRKQTRRLIAIGDSTRDEISPLV